MAETRFVNESLPPELLDYFELCDGVVHWSSKQIVSRSGAFRARRAPWGSIAGGRRVHGRGRLITFARCAVLTSDVAFALRTGDWPWQVGGAAPWILEHDQAATDIALARWRLDGETIVWRTDRGFTADGSPAYAAGSPALGFAMSGHRGRMLSSSGYGYLADDIRHLLTRGHWPWDACDWD